MADFKLEIRSQGWINDTPDGRYEDGAMDICSHGSIYCEIGGVQVSWEDADYGINQSALQLLRTLEEDRLHSIPDGRDRLPMDFGFLLCHGCGYPISFGCGVGTDWRVQHVGTEVIIFDPLLVDNSVVTRPPVQVVISLNEYRGQIVEFAREAKRFYFSFGPRLHDESEMKFHVGFWAEYDERLARAEALSR